MSLKFPGAGSGRGFGLGNFNDIYLSGGGAGSHYGHTSRFRTAGFQAAADRGSAATSDDYGAVDMVKLGNRRGMTLIELIVATAIMMILAYMAVPLARNRVRRQKERDLSIALREIRTAIDQYKDQADKGAFGPLKVGTEGYPETLEILVEGVKIANQVDKKVKFLRRIPLDPSANTRDSV